MQRPLTYDVTHLTHRLSYTAAPSGIEKVDLAFGQYFALNPGKLYAAVHYGLTSPVIFEPSYAGSLVQRVRLRWREDMPAGEDIKFQEIRAWLLNGGQKPAKAYTRESLREKIAANKLSLTRSAVLPFVQGGASKIPEGAIYLNVAQHAFEMPVYFRWLSKRQDLQRVFFIHDLLPLDYPEFWPAGHEDRFEKRVRCAAKHATAFITASKYVQVRLRAEMESRGRRNIPIFVHSLPPPNGTTAESTPADPELASASYFLVIGTLEPRKNCLLLLNIWRELAASGKCPPKLVLVGKRGWVNDQIIGAIERCASISPYVCEISGLASSSLRSLIVHAKAVLMPSFAEGFGLPIVEALSLGTPVIASDIAIFREISGDHALFRHPLDGMGWLTAIQELAQDNSPLARDARAAARGFVPVSNELYFDRLAQFLASL
jgi:glycosyltransferase involved in cell wall biosynthesis